MLRNLAARFRNWLGGRKPPPEDPDSFVRQPVRRRPPPLAAAVALEEPLPNRSINLFGFRLKRD